MFTSFVEAEEKKYMNQKKEKGYFLSKCAKYYKTYSLQQNRTKYIIRVKLLTSPFLHVGHICYARYKKNLLITFPDQIVFKISNFPP